MKFLAAAFLVTCVIARAAESAPAPVMQVAELASPTLPGAVGVSIAGASDRSVWLLWADRPKDEIALRFSVLDATAKKWSAPNTIIKDGGLFHLFEWPEAFPPVSLGGNGHATAVGFFGSAAHNLETAALFRQTVDGGKTWGRGEPLSPEHAEDIEAVALVTLADNRVLAAWIDGRDYEKREQNVMQLFARILGESGPDILIDSSVPRISQVSLTAFPDGGALLAYHGRTEDNLTTVRTARFRGQMWDDSKPLDNDVGRATGPRVASDGGRVAAAWFTAADNDPRVLASYSPDAGARFLMPLRIDNGKPAGHVDILILHDGALLVSWIESDGSVWLRRVTPDFAPDAPVLLAPAGATSVNTVPRLALVRDYAGGKTPAQVIAAFAAGGGAPLRTLLVTVPEGELLEAAKNCDCAPTAAELQGFPLRGTIVAIPADRGALRVRHDELPGVLAAATREFRVAPDILAAVQAGREFIGRIERRDGAWWLFDVRLLAEPPDRKL